MLFFGSRCERLCMMQFSLISLIPGLLRNLQDCADPELDTYERNLIKPTSLKTSDRSSLLNYMGLPLQIFGKVLTSTSIHIKSADNFSREAFSALIPLYSNLIYLRIMAQNPTLLAQQTPFFCSKRTVTVTFSSILMRTPSIFPQLLYDRPSLSQLPIGAG